MSEHTKGPWRVSDDGPGCREVRGNKSGPARQSRYLTEVCYTPGLERDEEDRANARLIAASPTMLSALRGIVAMGCWVPVAEGGTRCAFCNATNDGNHDEDCAYVAVVNAMSDAEGTL